MSSIPVPPPGVNGPAPDVERVTAALAAPFAACEVKWRPGATSGNRAMALAYVSSRTIQDRLDSVLGVAGWQDSFRVLADGSVVCRLRCKIGDTWITKVDVGSLSEQPDAGDRTKAAFSDALKRAAVKFGVGRYLYRLPSQWCDYDPAKRQFTRTPALPAWAAPGHPANDKPKDKPKDTTPIGQDGGQRLQALADQKGQRLQSWLEPHLDRAAFVSLDLVPTWAARLAWKALDKLPDAKPTNGTPADHGAADLGTLAAGKPSSRVPF